MAEVLSQSQIDALLNAARSGEMDLGSPAEPEKKYRKYDFYSPRKFTKDRIKMLNGIFDNYTRIINSRLNGLLHTSCEIQVDSVEEQRYYEFSNAMAEGDVLTLAHLELKGKQEETPTLLHVTTPVMLSMMDRLMGGEGDVDEELPVDYTFTDVELRLYEGLVKDLVDLMGGSWENYIQLKFAFDRVETNPTLVQIIGLDETVMIVGITLQFPNSTGRLSICLPGMMLTNIFTEISRENPGRRSAGEDNSENIFGSLRDSELEIVAELGPTQIKLSDLYHLNVGDVIDLNQSKDSPIQLCIGGRRWFDGRMGVFSKNVAIKIAETYQTEQEGALK